MKNYEYILLKLLNAQLTNNNKIISGDIFVKTVLQLSDSDWWNLIKLAQNHNVLSIIAENQVFIDNCNHTQKEYVFDEANKVIMRNYRLLWLASKYQKILNDAGIESVLIKGFATAIYYDVPEIRKSGDIDILIIDKNKIDKAIYVLLSKGLKYVDKQHSSHHIELVNDRGITVELHQTLAEHFDNKRIDNQLQDIVKEYKSKDKVKGVVKFGEYQSGINKYADDLGFYVEWTTENFLIQELGYWCRKNMLEVIGNIHDNPGLLEEKK